jgi:hypothetical protein
MGERGPVPKRSDRRMGHRGKDDAARVSRAPAAASVSSPAVDEEWHPVARAWFESLSGSGQSRFYEPSDWATAVLIAESMSRDLKPQFIGFAYTGEDQQEAMYETIPLKGASLGAYLRAMSSLLVTEGDRRRAAVELERAKPADAGEDHADATVTSLVSRLGG